jgi:hypothetical protein
MKRANGDSKMDFQLRQKAKKSNQFEEIHEVLRRMHETVFQLKSQRFITDYQSGVLYSIETYCVPLAKFLVKLENLNKGV